MGISCSRRSTLLSIPLNEQSECFLMVVVLYAWPHSIHLPIENWVASLFNSLGKLSLQLRSFLKTHFKKQFKKTQFKKHFLILWMYTCYQIIESKSHYRIALFSSHLRRFLAYYKWQNKCSVFLIKLEKITPVYTVSASEKAKLRGFLF